MATAVTKPGHVEALIALDSSVNNIPTSYSGAAGSAIRVGRSSNKKNFSFINDTDSDIEVSLDGGTTGHYACLGGGSILYEDVVISSAISIRSRSGSPITSGMCYLSVW